MTEEMARPEWPWVRERIREALAEAGLHLWGTDLENHLTVAALGMILDDRITSAGMVDDAREAFGAMDPQQLERLSDAIAYRIEPRAGEVALEFEEEP